MSDKSGLCMWCGRYTESVAADGLADCDRVECISARQYEDEFDRAAGVKRVDGARSFAALTVVVAGPVTAAQRAALFAAGCVRVQDRPPDGELVDCHFTLRAGDRDPEIEAALTAVANAGLQAEGFVSDDVFLVDGVRVEL